MLICLVVCSSGFGAAVGGADSSTTSAAAWARDTVQAQLQRQARPSVKPFTLKVSGDTVSAAVEAEPWFDENFLEFVATVPFGQITSASIEITSVTVPLNSPHGSDITLPPTLPTQNISYRPLGNIRGHQVVKLQMGAAVSGLSGARVQSGILRLTYETPPAVASASDTATTGPIAGMLRKFVANPDDLERFAMPLAAVAQPANLDGPPLGDATPGMPARFNVTQTGFVEFSGADLEAAGVDLSSVQTNQVSVFTDGRQVPVWSPALSEYPRAVTPEDRFFLYAEENNSTYTRVRSYWIRTDIPGRPMVRRTATNPPPIDENQYFFANMVVQEDAPPVLTKNDQFLSILDYRWVWWTWTPAGPGADVPNPHSFSEPGYVDFDLPGLAAAADVASSVTLHFYVHHWRRDSQPVPFEISLNGSSIGEAVISDSEDVSRAYSVQSSQLKAAGNRLEIMPIVTSSTAELADLAFDRMEIRYPRTYAVTSDTLRFGAPADGLGVVALDLPAGSLVAELGGDPVLWAATGDSAARALVPAPNPNSSFIAVTPGAIDHAEVVAYEKLDDLRDRGNSGDLVVIAWPDFIPPMQPWVEAKIAAGHDVRVVDVFDIYDQFGYGHQSPHAIRAFLHYAATSWQSSPAGPPASSILLVGDSSSDWRNEFRNDVINYVPVMRLEGNGDSFASDQWYVSLFGDDPYADALIGRFSVNSVADLENLVAKQLDYANSPTPGGWQNTLGFVADHSDFEDAVNRVMQQVVPPRFFLDKIMMSELPWVDNFYFPKNIADAQQAKVSTEATGRIRDMFNNGASVVTYFGHGSPNVWSSERMWFGGDSPNSDNLMLTNRDKLAIVINMTCNSGAIDYPQPRWNVCISEDFMRVENGGAVACFVPSGPGLTVQHERLMMEIGRTLFLGDREPIGEAVQLAMWRYLAAQNPPELAQMYILLGDPTLVPQISRPADDVSLSAPAGASAEFLMLPPEITAAEQPTQVQYNVYDDSGIEPGETLALQAGARLVKRPDDATTAPATLAISMAGAGADGQSESLFLPANSLSGIRLIQWRRVDNPSEDDGRATLHFRLKNEMPLPVAGVRVELMADGCTTCPGAFSDAYNIAGLSDEQITAEVEMQPGINTFSVALTAGDQRVRLQADPPVSVAGLRPDGDAGKSYPPAAVDPASIKIRYRKVPDGVTATLSARVYVLARETLSNLSIGLAGTDGIVVPSSIVPVAAVGPGASAPVGMMVTLLPHATSDNYTLRFDPSGYFGEFRRFEPVTIPLGSAHYPDLVISSITSPETSPVEGETIFFDVAVENRGETTVDGVQVEAVQVLSSGLEEKLKSQVAVEQPPVSLAPGESDVIRVRWDPFENAGKNVVRFRADSVYNIPDRNPDDNRVEFAVDVRTKPRLRKGPLQVLPLTEEDRRQRQIRIAAEITNTGESDAHGLQARVYGSPEMRPDDLLGQVDIERVPAGETHRVVLTYKFKPGEEDRKFRLTYEVLYKGSRQRVPVDDD